MRPLAGWRMPRFLPFLLVLALLQGCAMVPLQQKLPAADATPDNELQWKRRAASLLYLKTFTLDARLAVKGEGGGGNLHWVQEGENINLTVSGPLGMGGLRASGTLAQALIETNGEKFWTADPEATFKERIGWNLPLRKIRYWVLGVPQPDEPEEHSLDTQGRLLTLKQGGWEIQYPEYQAVTYVELPRFILLKSADVEARVVIDGWQL